MKKCLSLFLILSFFHLFSFAQSDSTNYWLDSVVVSVGRLQNPLLTTPKSVTSLAISKIQNARQQFSVNEYLTEVPGLFALNPNNFAQDLRVSIRGFGARAAFGIRGVKILVDGIPETTPDGQGQTDNLDLGLIENLEILRGPSSGLYGNASGGVISISTQSKLSQNFAEGGLTFGSYGMQRYQLKAGLTTGQTDFVVNGGYNTINGYRQQSGMQQTILSANVLHEFSEKTNIKFIFNYSNSPQADDPGGINLDNVKEDRTAARDRNLLFQAGEEVSQLKLAGILNSNNFQTKVFFISRDFYGKLPFEFGGIVDLQRSFFGNSSHYTLRSKTDQINNEFLVGYDLQWQRDDRQRFRNLEGVQGESTFNQEENFSNVGLYITDHLQAGKWNINASLRYDINSLSANDLAPENGDDSGDIQLNALNGGIGISYESSLSFAPFTRFSTSFETPTLSELSANPTGAEGFNEELNPQKARNIEIGAKGIVQRSFQYEISLFSIQTTDEILPYEIEDFPDRDFFRNAGKTQRTGLEMALKYAPGTRWLVSGTYTYSDFQFKEYTNGDNVFDGQQLPGIPMHTGALSVRYIHPKGAFVRLIGQQIGSLFANDSNEVEVEGFTLINLNLGYEIKTEGLKIIPFFGVNNLLDTEYNDNIRINAFGGRYYEPAQEINIFGGIRLRIQ